MRSIFRPGTPTVIRVVVVLPAVLALMALDVMLIGRSPLAPWVSTMISALVGTSAFLAIGALAGDGGWRQRLRFVLIATTLYASVTFATTWVNGAARYNWTFLVQTVLALTALVAMSRRPRVAFGLVVVLALLGLLTTLGFLAQAALGRMQLPFVYLAMYTYLQGAAIASLWHGRKLLSVEKPVDEPALQQR